MTGALRYENDRARGIRDEAVALPGDPRWVDTMAHAAEMFIAARYGQEHQVTVDAPTPCDLQMEFRGRRNRKVVAHLDVKWSPKEGAPLTLHAKDADVARGGMPPHTTHICTAYVLVVGASEQSFRIVGWAWGHDLVKSWNASLPRPAWSLPQASLRPNFDLLMAATFGLSPT